MQPIYDLLTRIQVEDVKTKQVSETSHKKWNVGEAADVPATLCLASPKKRGQVIRIAAPATIMTVQRPKMLRKHCFLLGFDFNMCLAQPRALFQQLNFQNGSGGEVFLAIFNFQKRLGAEMA